MRNILEYELQILQEKDFLIVVEGQKDMLALKELGFSNVLTIEKKPLYKILDICSEEECVVILTDLDSEGKKLYSKLNHYLSQMGIRIDNRFRYFLFRETKLRQIEGLANYLERNI